MGALILSERLFGFKTKLNKIVDSGKETIDTTAGIRVLSFDAIMEKHLDKVDQIVLPGAGFDLISLKYTKDSGHQVFELDQSATIQIKTATLNKAGIAHDWIHYIPVDYKRESWSENLLNSGFDPHKKTLFIWESVSLFLEKQEVEESLLKMAELCCEGSVVAQDFYSEHFISGKYSFAVRSQKNMIENMGEKWKFGIDMKENAEGVIEAFLNKHKLKIKEFHQFGEKLHIDPYYCIVEAERLNT
jgi:methyltransferase (TIGR00027 family)